MHVKKKKKIHIHVLHICRKAHNILWITDWHTLWSTATQKCARAHTHMHAHTYSLAPFVCFGREGSVSLSSASTCSLLSWKKLNKYRANKTNHSSHALLTPISRGLIHIHTHTRIGKIYILIHSSTNLWLIEKSNLWCTHKWLAKYGFTAVQSS